MKSSRNKLFLFDRDGIINVRPLGTYVKSIPEFKFHPDFFYVFRRIKEAGYKTAVVTNQQGIGKKLMSDKDLQDIHKYMQSELLRKTEYAFDKIFYCPSLKNENDFRRKPNPGMLMEAMDTLDAKPADTYIIGDSISDIEAGKNAGVSTILINALQSNLPDYHFYTLKEFILLFNRHKKIINFQF